MGSRTCREYDVDAGAAEPETGSVDSGATSAMVAGPATGRAAAHCGRRDGHRPPYRGPGPWLLVDDGIGRATARSSSRMAGRGSAALPLLQQDEVRAVVQRLASSSGCGVCLTWRSTQICPGQRQRADDGRARNSALATSADRISSPLSTWDADRSGAAHTQDWPAPAAAPACAKCPRQQGWSTAGAIGWGKRRTENGSAQLSAETSGAWQGRPLCAEKPGGRMVACRWRTLDLVRAEGSVDSVTWSLRFVVPGGARGEQATVGTTTETSVH